VKWRFFTNCCSGPCRLKPLAKTSNAFHNVLAIFQQLPLQRVAVTMEYCQNAP
jgi:hypothetical protein